MSSAPPHPPAQQVLTCSRNNTHLTTSLEENRFCHPLCWASEHPKAGPAVLVQSLENWGQLGPCDDSLYKTGMRDCSPYSDFLGHSEAKHKLTVSVTAATAKWTADLSYYLLCVCGGGVVCFLVFIYLAALGLSCTQAVRSLLRHEGSFSLWHVRPSSLTRDRTQAPHIGSMES